MKKLLLSVSLLFTLAGYSQNNAVNFDGSNDYVEIADNNAIDLSANFTLETWIYPTGPGSQPTEGGIILNKEGSYEIARFANGTIQFALSANGAGNDWAWINTGLVAPLNQWSHIALVKSGSSVIVYLNDITPFSTSSQPATLTANANNLRTGGRTITSHNFAGYIDEVRIWNTSRTQNEIKTYLFNKNLSVSASGLVAYYRMNSVSGTSAVNSSANTSGIDGILVNGPTWITSPVQFSANALSFDGTDDYVIIPHVVSSDFTVEYWMKTTSTGPGGPQWYNGNGIVDAEVNGAGNDWGTSLTGSKLLFGIGQSGMDVSIQSSSDVNTGNWVHIAVTWIQSTGAMKLYINGVQEATGTGSTNLRNAPSRITIGEIQSNINRFNGSVDEVRIWNIVRTQAQIQATMNIEIDPATATSLTASYTFNQGAASAGNTGLIILLDQKGVNNGTLTNFSLSGSSSNYIVQNNNFFVLPLQWQSFTAKAQDNKTLLNWSITSELNALNYEVQRSADGINWTSIGVVAASGNSGTAQYYSFTDQLPLAGINHYRLLQRDMDSRIAYSKVLVCNFSDAGAGLKIYPNPVLNGSAAVYLKQANSITVYNSAGMTMLKQELPSGSSLLDLSALTPGTYYIRTKNDKISFIVQ